MAGPITADRIVANTITTANLVAGTITERETLRRADDAIAELDANDGFIRSFEQLTQSFNRLTESVEASAKLDWRVFVFQGNSLFARVVNWFWRFTRKSV